MRDDIHKNAPVAARWKRVIKAHTRDADWSSEGERVLDDAIRGELGDIRGDDFLSQLAGGLRQQAGLLPGTRDLESLRSLARNPAQECAAGHAIRLADQEGPHAVQIKIVIACAIGEVVDRQFYATENHVAMRFPSQRTELMRRMQTSRAGVQMQALITRVLEGSLSARPSRRPGLRIDDGLPTPRRGG